ncbi:MAG: helix-turn-helix transcriptional regulator [Alphaproteobacteria bacterium]|nr:helix-turn-helix transcriptional regulator [Alphaproteobacteria bacterium]
MAGKQYVHNSVDNHIGHRMQLRRSMLGLSQKDLGDLCGVSCQQIQKYESATNRISASRLFQVGRALDTPVSFFFCGLPGNLPDETKATKSRRVSDQDEGDPMGKTETLRLINLYWKLSSDKQRAIVMDILTALNQGDRVSVTEQQPDGTIVL